jgi:hypothetical protein
MRWVGDRKAVSMGVVKECVDALVLDEWRPTYALYGDLDEPKPSLEQVRRALLGLANAFGLLHEE